MLKLLGGNRELNAGHAGNNERNTPAGSEAVDPPASLRKIHQKRTCYRFLHKAEFPGSHLAAVWAAPG